MSKPFCATVTIECPFHGGESVVAVTHDHGGEHPSGDVEQLWAAEVVRKGCECAESEIEERAIDTAQGEVGAMKGTYPEIVGWWQCPFCGQVIGDNECDCEGLRRAVREATVRIAR